MSAGAGDGESPMRPPVFRPTTGEMPSLRASASAEDGLALLSEFFVMDAAVLREAVDDAAARFNRGQA